MTPTVRIAVVGDHDPAVIAHQANPRALALAGESLKLSVLGEWIPTESIQDSSRIAGFDGIWCVPATPYRSMAGALAAIRFAREKGRPFLGTCGGFQHAILEYARSVLGWADADHAETAPEAERALISPLACGLVEVTGEIRLLEPSRLAFAYGTLEITEGYHCNYGLNPRFREEIARGPLFVSGVDVEGAVRAIGLHKDKFCRACFDGKYPIPIPPDVRQSKLALEQKRHKPGTPSEEGGPDDGSPESD